MVGGTKSTKESFGFGRACKRRSGARVFSIPRDLGHASENKSGRPRATIEERNKTRGRGGGEEQEGHPLLVYSRHSAKMSSTRRGRGSSSSAAMESPSEPSAAGPRTPSKRSKQASTSGGQDSVEQTLRSPPKRARARGVDGNSKVVTPATESTTSADGRKKRGGRSPRSPGRSLDLSSVREDEGDSTEIDEGKSTSEEEGKLTGKTKLPFGRNVKQIEIPRNVSRVYKIVHAQTGTTSDFVIPPQTKQAHAYPISLLGSVGGNGHGGAIYGELTTGSSECPRLCVSLLYTALTPLLHLHA